MKVWLLTSGTYADYGVVGVFSSLESLEKVKATDSDKEYNDPEEYEMDQLVAYEVGPTWRSYVRNGHIVDEATGYFFGKVEFRHPSECVIINHPNPWSCVFGCTVISPVSQEHAHKVAIEQHQVWLHNS